MYSLRSTSLIERFRDLESGYAIFNKLIKNVPIWERLRFKIFRKIKQQHVSGQAHTLLDLDTKDILKRTKSRLRNLVSKNPYLATSSDVLFVGHQRRKKERDGYWWDIYCGPIHVDCPLYSVHFEYPNLLSHKSPAQTDLLQYLEFLEFGGKIFLTEQSGRNSDRAIMDNHRVYVDTS